MAILKSFRSFPKNFYTVVTMEFFERGSYYGVMSVLSVYMALSVGDGGLGFSKTAIGTIKGTITPLLYFLPILAGTIADRYGYKKVLSLAFLLMSSGYALTGMVHTYELVFASLLLMAVGAGLFKPLISGTIARSTDENNSALGFGIYYWSINLGAFIFPLFLIPWLKDLGWNYIFIMAAVGTGWLFIFNLIAFKEPPKPKNTKSIGQTLGEMVLVITNLRFILLIVIYSLFWVLYFQMYDSVLWYMTEHLNMTPVNNAVNSLLSNFMANPNWKFEAEHVTVVNAGVIIAFQLLVTFLVKKAKPLPTMILGIGFGTIGMAMLAISSSPWIFVAGIMVFTVGEMVAHPKFISYIGLIAPPDKKAVYMGYSFLYGFIGSGVGAFVGAALYVQFIEKTFNPTLLWLLFSGIGVISIIGLLIYNRIFGKK